MKPWTRWQDWVALVAGAYALLSPLWTSTSTEAMWSLMVLGALIALVSLAALARPGMDAMEYGQAVLGALLFLAPFVFAYTALSAAAWTSWIAGVLTVVVALAALPAVRHIGGGRAAHQH